MTKDELINKYRDINVDAGWWDCTYDDFIEQLGLVGIVVASSDIAFRGFWSQGDGACFSMIRHTLLDLVQGAQKWMLEQWPLYEGNGEDGGHSGGRVIGALHDYCVALLASQEVYLLDGETRAVMEGTTVRCYTEGHYCHSGTMRAEVEDNPFCTPEDDSVALSKLFDAQLRGLADALYRTLEEEHDYQTEDEQVWESIKANGLDKELTEDEEDDEPCNA